MLAKFTLIPNLKYYNRGLRIYRDFTLIFEADVCFRRVYKLSAIDLINKWWTLICCYQRLQK